jgi:hypothetical protein
MVGVAALVLVTPAGAGVTLFRREREVAPAELISESVWKTQVPSTVAEIVG